MRRLRADIVPHHPRRPRAGDGCDGLGPCGSASSPPAPTPRARSRHGRPPCSAGRRRTGARSTGRFPRSMAVSGCCDGCSTTRESRRVRRAASCASGRAPCLTPMSSAWSRTSRRRRRSRPRRALLRLLHEPPSPSCTSPTWTARPIPRSTRRRWSSWQAARSPSSRHSTALPTRSRWWGVPLRTRRHRAARGAERCSQGGTPSARRGRYGGRDAGPEATDAVRREGGGVRRQRSGRRAEGDLR